MRQIFLWLIVLVIGGFSFMARGALAASLFFSPATGSYQVGDTFSVSIAIASADRAVNAVSGVINFPPDKLQVLGLVKEATIGLWIQEPTFSNTSGQITFEGVILNPGFQGNAGQTLKINFRAKASGNASLRLLSGAVLANDGLGTNVLSTLGGAQFAIGPAGAQATTPVVTPAANLPLALQITSPTHPETDRWYANSQPEFVWRNPNDLTAVRMQYDKFPNSTPGVLYTPPIEEKKLTDLKDGVWYFHLQARNAAGWGPVSHFRFQIDTAKPDSLSITEVPRADASVPVIKVALEATDALSGLSNYELKINDQLPLTLPSTATTTIFETPILKTGDHTLIVKALDAAGNYLIDYFNFTVAPLVPPTIIEYPARVGASEPLTLEGKTYPEAEVTISFGRDLGPGETRLVRSDARGNFLFSYDSRLLKNGVYLFTAAVRRSDGASSLPSEPVTIIVERSWLNQISSWTINFLALFIPMLSLLLVLGFLVLSSARRTSRYRARVRREVREAELTAERAFALLREDIREELKLLEKAKNFRALTREEGELAQRLKADLDEAEKLVKKEINDIPS